MSTVELAAVEIERASEQIRQERETFDLQRSHAERWFNLRLAMGYASIVLLAAVMAISGYVLLHPADYSGGVLSVAGGALFVDVLGLLGGVWKISLSPELAGTLAPVTKAASLDEPASDAQSGR